MKSTAPVLSQVLVFLCWCTSFASAQATTSRLIPDDNLSYPVLIRIGASRSASGFYLNTGSNIFLVTAAHVLFLSDGRTLIGTQADALSYAGDPKERTPALFKLDLKVLTESGNIKTDNIHDVAVVRIGSVAVVGAERTLTPMAGVEARSAPISGLVPVGFRTVKRFAEVLVSNEVIVFGYPTSIGIPQDKVPQLDYSRPLLRKGIVAGTNEALKSIILDCAVYPGNSGGPVVELSRDGAIMRFQIIGVIIQYVPFVQGDAPDVVSNSGYAVAAGMDTVLDLVETFK